MKIFCVIPAYNEEKSIGKVIDETKSFVDEIIIVDDCSTDNTSKTAREKKVTVLKHVINRGQGAALQTGNEYAIENGADVIVHIDADGQFLSKEIPDVIAPVVSGEYDVALGSRFLGKKSNMPNSKKFIIMPLARFINKIFFNSKLTDPQNGFRVLSRKAAKKITIKNDGSAHCSEILHKIFKYNLKVKEIPITVVYNDFGQSFFSGKGRGMGGIRILKDLLLSFLID